MRALLLAPLLLAACGNAVIPDGYVMRSISANAARGSVGITVTFDNVYLPQTGGNCIGIEVCTTTD